MTLLISWDKFPAGICPGYAMIARMTSFPPPMLRIFSLLSINAFKSPSSSKAQRPNKKSDHHPNFLCTDVYLWRCKAQRPPRFWKSRTNKKRWTLKPYGAHKTFVETTSSKQLAKKKEKSKLETN